MEVSRREGLVITWVRSRNRAMWCCSRASSARAKPRSHRGSPAAWVSTPRYVNSPTFTLINEYRGGRHRLYHVDLYRLEGMEEVATLGLEDYFDGSGVTVIEWPEHGEDALPEERLLVRLAFLSDTKRTLRFYARGERYRQLVEDYKKETFG